MNTISIFLIFFLALGLGFSISQIIGTNNVDSFLDEQTEPKFNYNSSSEEEIINNCKNLSLKDSAYCLRDSIKPFYNYTPTKDEFAKKMTFEEIKELGTDCTGWAYLYLRLAEGIGYDASTIRIEGDGKAHRTFIINNREGFCVINFKHIECFMYNI